MTQSNKWTDAEVQLGRRLCAAYLSHMMGIRSADYTLKRYVIGRGANGSYWPWLARQVYKHVGDTFAQALGRGFPEDAK